MVLGVGRHEVARKGGGVSLPDNCPNCGSNTWNQSGSRRHYACESWINEGRDLLNHKTDTCCDRRAIREAAAIIREMMDEWGMAMPFEMIDKAEEWLKDNAP